MKNTVLLSPLELGILNGLQKGKSDSEVATFLGISKRDLHSNLQSIRQKLNVRSREHAIDRAVAKGFLQGASETGSGVEVPVSRVGIVGCGKGGVAVLSIFKENPGIEVAFVVDSNINAQGVAFAESLGIPVFDDYACVESEDVDLIINLTGSEEVEEDLRRLKSPQAELMGGVSALLMWQMTEERRKRLAERDRTLQEHESLYHLGVIIENMDSMSDSAYAIVDYACKLIGMPAGSLTICDENGEDMELVAAKGFSEEFLTNKRWKIRKGGLTDLMLNQSTPYFVQDIHDLNEPSPALVNEGVRSVLAAPLIIQRSVVGILYLNDFKKKEVSAEEISLFSLLTIYAAITVERVRSIERLWHQSQHDGLTGLLNHRSLTEQLQKETERSSRHNGKFSIIMIDIDNFKSYNDSFGHLEGNRVLKHVSRLLMKTARVSDTVARFGGEEFCILVPELDREQVMPFAERVVQNIAEHEFPNRQVTISAGVATFPNDGKTMTDLIKCADANLYCAKRSGKNRVCNN